jgi:hypothetical protein
MPIYFLLSIEGVPKGAPFLFCVALPDAESDSVSGSVHSTCKVVRVCQASARRTSGFGSVSQFLCDAQISWADDARLATMVIPVSTKRVAAFYSHSFRK